MAIGQLLALGSSCHKLLHDGDPLSYLKAEDNLGWTAALGSRRSWACSLGFQILLFLPRCEISVLAVRMSSPRVAQKLIFSELQLRDQEPRCDHPIFCDALRVAPGAYLAGSVHFFLQQGIRLRSVSWRTTDRFLLPIHRVGQLAWKDHLLPRSCFHRVLTSHVVWQRPTVPTVSHLSTHNPAHH